MVSYASKVDYSYLLFSNGDVETKLKWPIYISLSALNVLTKITRDDQFKMCEKMIVRYIKEIFRSNKIL